MGKNNFIAFYYLSLLVSCKQINEHIDELHLFLKSTYNEHILEKIVSASEMGPIFGHYSPQSFRPCETQLIEFIDDVTQNLDDGKQIDALIMDFSNAFDKVSNNLL